MNDKSFKFMAFFKADLIDIKLQTYYCRARQLG